MKKALIVLLIIVVAIGTTAYWYVSRLTAVAAPLVVAEETRRVIDTGELIGYVENNGSSAWLGIPFAKPPVDNLRWKAPRAPDSWQGVRESISFGSACAQRAMLGGEDGPEISGDEDCLYLNIWEPADAEAGRPVMVWIHGGGNHIGEAGTVIYNGSNLAATQDVVVVTINYRLGPFGWLTHPGLRDGDPADNSGNYGTLDIVRALEWVQANINQFHGDVNNVTIFGESAGGFNVLTMMVSPLAAGLYHKAIVESGGLTLLPLGVAENFHDDVEPGDTRSSRELVNSLLTADGKGVDRDAAKVVQLAMTDDAVGEYLRGKSTREILVAQGGSGMQGTPYIYGDGYVLPKNMQADELFADRSTYNVTPVILGTNRDEIKLFMMLGPEATERILGIPYKIRDEIAYDRDSAYGTDAWKIRAVDNLAEHLRDTQGDSVYAYRFDWDELRSILTLDLGKLLGAAHALEIPFVFGNFDFIDRTMVISGDAIPARDALSASMMSYWAEFAHTGNPGRGRDGTENEWTNWENGAASNNRLLILDSANDGGIRMSPYRITREDLRARLLADESFATQEDHCQAYDQLFGGDDFVQSEYESLGRSGCGAEHE